MCYEIISKGERIVEMLCDGMTIKQITLHLEISSHQLEEMLRKVRMGAHLPYEKRTYKARKDDILANIKKWKAYKIKLIEMEKEYRASLVPFDF